MKRKTRRTLCDHGTGHSALIAAEELSLSYGEKLLLHQVSFEILPGRLYCLMGANGCGKTTLINCLLGLHRQDSGRVRIGSRDASAMKPRELARMISYVPQAHEKTFPYTVEQIVMMGRSVHADFLKGPDESESAFVRSVLDRVGIASLSDRPYTRISGGELQLVMLARALAQETPVILMDEPSAHLDFRNELVFLQTVAELVHDSGTAVLMATHSPNQPFFFERKGVDTEVIALADGSVHCTGRPSEVLTEERIREIYKVRARRMEEGSLRQIVALETE